MTAIAASSLPAVGTPLEAGEGGEIISLITSSCSPAGDRGDERVNQDKNGWIQDKILLLLLDFNQYIFYCILSHTCVNHRQIFHHVKGLGVLSSWRNINSQILSPALLAGILKRILFP